MSKRKEVITKLNEAMKQVDVNKFEYIGTTTNLKMYDAYYVSENANDFHQWCDMVYEDEYQEMLQEYNVDMIHVGRTSSFFFENKLSNMGYFDVSDFEGTTRHPITLENKRLMMFIEFMKNHCSVDIEYSCNDLDWDCSEIVDLSEVDWLLQQHYEEYSEEAEEEVIDDIFMYTNLTLLAQEFEEFCNDELDNLNHAYMWLESFKANQVEYYKEWLACQDEY